MDGASEDQSINPVRNVKYWTNEGERVFKSLTVCPLKSYMIVFKAFSIPILTAVIEKQNPNASHNGDGQCFFNNSCTTS